MDDREFDLLVSGRTLIMERNGVQWWSIPLDIEGQLTDIEPDAWDEAAVVIVTDQAIYRLSNIYSYNPTLIFVRGQIGRG